MIATRCADGIDTAAGDTSPVDPTGSPAVVVAVISWNTRELLRGCLQALEPAVRSGSTEVWVLDNASADGSAAMVAETFHWAHLIAARENRGFGAGVNAIATASATRARESGRRPSPWLLAANADIVLTPAALETLTRAGEADPRDAVIAPRLRLPDGSIQHSVHPFPGLRSALVLSLGLGRVLPRLGEAFCLDGLWDQSRPRRADWAHGACLLLRRETFDAVGGFDPGQFLYAEDLDLCWRLHRAGWTTRYEPGAVVEHVHAAAIAQLYGDGRDMEAERSALAWLLRRRGTAVMRLWALIHLLGALARSAGPRGAPFRRYARLHLSGLLSSRDRLERHR